MDLAILASRIFTGNPAQPWAEAVAIKDGKFVFVGSALTVPAVLLDIRTTAADGQPPVAPRRELASYLESRLAPQDTYVIGDTGLVPFLTGGRVIDAYCLNTREATSPEIDGSPDLLADWIFEQRPRFVVIQSFQAEGLTPVWPADAAMANHDVLDSDYRRAATFGGTEDVYHYFLFERSRLAAGN